MRAGKTAAARAKRSGRRAAARKSAGRGQSPGVHRSVLEEARRSGLLRGGKSEHVSFRAPPALIAAAKRETGIASTSELGLLALAMLAQRDPFVVFMKRNYGRLGKDHTLDT